jgi:hypothetical protein
MMREWQMGGVLQVLSQNIPAIGQLSKVRLQQSQALNLSQITRELSCQS